jgi:uncharacterized protein (DUF433 family)
MPEVSERITIDPGVCGGRPCIRGLRIPFSKILDILASDYASKDYGGLFMSGG